MYFSHIGVPSFPQDVLMDVRDKLLFEPEYAGNFKEKQPPKSSLKIPWTWLPGALCLLQEVSLVTNSESALRSVHAGCFLC